MFPFAIEYTEAIDPNKTIIKDIAVKCGFIGNSKSDIPVNYQLTVSRLLAQLCAALTVGYFLVEVEDPGSQDFSQLQRICLV